MVRLLLLQSTDCSLAHNSQILYKYAFLNGEKVEILKTNFEKEGITFEDVAKRSRKPSVLKLRNKFCIEAYINGYGYATIGKYLGLNHVTIMHCVNKIKTK